MKVAVNFTVFAPMGIGWDPRIKGVTSSPESVESAPTVPATNHEEEKAMPDQKSSQDQTPNQDVAEKLGSFDFTSFATRVSQVQGLPTTDNLQIDEISEALSAALDVLAHEVPLWRVVLELETRKATRPPRPGA